MQCVHVCVGTRVLGCLRSIVADEYDALRVYYCFGVFIREVCVCLCTHNNFIILSRATLGGIILHLSAANICMYLCRGCVVSKHNAILLCVAHVCTLGLETNNGIPNLKYCVCVFVKFLIKSKKAFHTCEHRESYFLSN